MARAAKPAIPAKPAAVARAPAPELLDVGGDDVVAAAPDSLVVAAVPVHKTIERKLGFCARGEQNVRNLTYS